MLVCLDCGGRGGQPCRECGSERVAEATDNAEAITRLPAAVIGCARCGVATEPLYFRRFRRVVGLLVFDRIWDLPGYYCDGCRRTMFFRWQGLTLVLGWWGVFALVFRNPYAIMVNFQALNRAPRAPDRWGAITLPELAQAAEQGVTIDELRRPALHKEEVIPSRSDEVRAAWENEEVDDPAELDRITRRALRKAKRN